MQPRTNSTNIVDLCENMVGIYKGVTLKVTIQMCLRMAALVSINISGMTSSVPSYSKYTARCDDLIWQHEVSVILARGRQRTAGYSGQIPP